MTIALILSAALLLTAAPVPGGDSLGAGLLPHAATEAVAEAVAATVADDSAQVRPARRTTYPVAPDLTWHYDRPRLGRTLLNIPRHIAAYPRWAWQKEHRWGVAGVVAGTALLYWLDEPVINAAQALGRTVHLTAESHQKTLVAVPFRPGNSTGALDLELNVPTTLNGAMYFLGDGWTHLTITTSFWAYGLLGRDNRAAQTAAQITSALAATGIVVQTLKRTTGRESPYTTDYPRGRWDFFPNQGEYTRHVPQHDAFPTGHLATVMATVTVIADNYAEYRFIRPVGYGLMGLLGYAMLNNGVHWASDYPLGLAIGYGMAKLAVASGRRADLTGSARAPHAARVAWAPVVRGPFKGAQVQWRW